MADVAIAEALDAQRSAGHRGRGDHDSSGPVQAGVGAENPVTPCDAQVHLNESTEAISPERSAIAVAGGGVRPAGAS